MSGLPPYLQAGLASSSPSSARLPVILCLHGGGTNATIFNIQSMRIQRLLSDKFNFIFLDGPMPTTAGAGVMPVFEGCDPYFRWFRVGKDINILPPQTKTQLTKALDYIKAEEKAGNLGKTVGFLGFSQGGKLGAGLLWEQMVKGPASGWDFKFGVMCNAIAPPMCEILEEDKALRISIPTLHVIGEEDPWSESGRKLYDGYFDKKSSSKFEFANGHRLPTADDETKNIADEILRMWQECGKKEVRNVSEKDALKIATLPVGEETA